MSFFDAMMWSTSTYFVCGRWNEPCNQKPARNSEARL